MPRMAILLLLASLTATASAERPNVIFLMDDQRRFDALGVVNGQVQTPVLDRLARSGVRFSQAVCQAPMCIPSRNSMMLGLYPNEIGVLRNGRGIPDDELPTPTLAKLFRRAGYQTAGFGKTHWGARRLQPGTRGFEVRYAAECPERGAVNEFHCGQHAGLGATEVEVQVPHKVRVREGGRDAEL